MNSNKQKYIILYRQGMGLLDEYEVIEGKTGIDALNKYLPEHMVGVVKRVRAWEEPDFIIQKFYEKDGRRYSRFPKVGYTYKHPQITKKD